MDRDSKRIVMTARWGHHEASTASHVERDRSAMMSLK